MDPDWGRVVGGVLAGSGALLVAGSAAAAQLSRPPATVGVPVLRYRLVGRPIPGSPINDLRLPVSKFEAHIRHMRRRGFVPVTLEEALRRRRERSFLQAKPVVLTFDGPYEGFASVAWPILCSHNFNRVTLFYPPAYLGETELAFQEGRAEPLLTTPTLARLVKEGVRLGVQLAVNRGDAEDALRNELRAGREALAPLSGEPPSVVAYPFALPEAVSAARDAGFVGGAVLGDGVLPRRGSPFAIPRYAIQPETELVQLAMILARRVGSALY